MSNQDFPEAFLKLISTITNKRAKIVIDHIIANGFITTQDLEITYGYSHPPRAARDVREAGIPLETFNVKSDDGKSIAAYKFGDLTQIHQNRINGRQIFSKKFKNQLYVLSQGQCAVCNGHFEERYLQIDHKVPYEINGDTDAFQQKTEDYMLLCGSCNRSKSWSCEQCENWLITKEPKDCLTCYWGSPTDYSHIALKPIRKLELVWQGNEITDFEALKATHKTSNTLAEYVKKLLKGNF